MNEAMLAAHLRAVVMTQRIYPRGSPVVEEGITRFLSEIAAPLAEGKPVTVSRVEDKIFVNQVEAAQAAGLIPIFEEHKIQSLRFRPGSTPEEMRELVALLGQKQPKDTSFSNWLRAQNVVHIQVNELLVVEMTSQEEIVRKGEVHFREMKSYAEVERTLEESFDVIDQISEDSRRKELRQGLAQRLTFLESSILKEMFEKPPPDKPGAEGLLDSVLQALPAEKVTEMFSEIVRWQEQLGRVASRDATFDKETARLKSFAAKLTTAPAAKTLAPAVFEDLAKRGLIAGVPMGLRERRVEESVDEAKGALAQMESFIGEGNPGRLADLMGRLLGEGNVDWVLKLLDGFVRVLSEGSPLTRHRAAAEAGKLFPLFWENGRAEAEGRLIEALLAAAEAERSPVSYKEIIAALTSALVHDYRERDFEKAFRMSGLLRRHFWERNALVEGRSKEASDALRKAAADLLEIIQQDMLGEDEKARHAAAQLLLDLGNSAVPYYVEVIKTCPDLRLRRLCAEKLKNHREAAVAHLASEFYIGSPTPVLLNLLSVLDDFPDPEIVDKSAAFAGFPDVAFRREIIKWLTRVPGEKADTALLRYLDDPEDALRVEAIRGVGDRKVRGGALHLAPLVKIRSTAVQEEVCLSLGKLGDDRAVPALGSLLKKESRLFGHEVEESVRIRAAWALTQIPSVTARQVLASFKEDGNPMVREMALKFST